MLFLFAFLLRIVATLILHYYSIQIGREGYYPFSVGSDDRFHYGIATEVAFRLRESYFVEPQVFMGFYYPVFLGMFYAVSGASLLAGQLLNAWLGALTVIPVYLLTRRLSNNCTKASLASLLVALYPSHIFNSTQLLKDSLVVLLGLIALYELVSLLQRFNVIGTARLLLWLIALVLLRGYVAYSLVLVTAVSLLFSLHFSRPRRAFYLIALVLVAGLTLSAMGRGFLGIRQIVAMLNPEFLSSFRETAYSIGGSSLGLRLDYSSPLTFLRGGSVSLMYLVLAPFPWQIRSLEWGLAGLEMLGWYAILPLVLKGSVTAISKPLHRPVLLLALGLFIAIALFSDNIGANTRLRMLPLICLMILAISTSRPLRVMRYKFTIQSSAAKTPV
jgi:hypothetical protein